MKGLIVSIYKNPTYNCSNGGISSRFDEALLIGDGIPEIFDAPNLPRIRIVQGNIRETVKAIPVDEEGRSLESGAMAGGAFIYTSDSRFSEYVEKLLGTRFYGAVSLHDRFER